MYKRGTVLVSVSRKQGLSEDMQPYTGDAKTSTLRPLALHLTVVDERESVTLVVPRTPNTDKVAVGMVLSSDRLAHDYVVSGVKHVGMRVVIDASRTAAAPR